VFSGDTKPTRTLVEAAQGCDLLIHETFLPPKIFAELTSFPIEQARMVVNEGHTPARAAGIVFDMVRPRMAAMWHCHVIDGYIEPVFEEMRTAHSGPAALSVVGPSDTARTLATPHPSPAWWKEAAIDWQGG
jgi:ribonuclease Z